MTEICRRQIYIEGSARPETEPSVADPMNIVGGARYSDCEQPGFKQGRAGAWLCETHFKEEQEFLEEWPHLNLNIQI